MLRIRYCPGLFQPISGRQLGSSGEAWMALVYKKAGLTPLRQGLSYPNCGDVEAPGYPNDIVACRL